MSIYQQSVNAKRKTWAGITQVDLEKLEKLARLVLSDLENLRENGSGYNRLSYYHSTLPKFRNVLQVAANTLPEHTVFFMTAYNNIYMTVYAAEMIVNHLVEIIQLEKTSEIKIKEMKIFEGAEDKLKEAGICFRKDDYPSTFHSLNTSLELVLKDKLGIPTTITNINTSTIIDILVSRKIEPYLYLMEIKKHVLAIDNKIKHQGYSPSKIESINGMKAMEDLISKLRNKGIEIPEDVKKRVFEGL